MNKSIDCVSIKVVNPELTDIEWIRLFVGIVSALFFVVGWISILMFITVIKQMTTLSAQRKLYILSLNNANALRLIVVSVSIGNMLMEKWLLPNLLCPILPFIGTMTLTSSTWVAVFMFVEVYMGVRHLSRVSRNYMAKVQIGSAWLIGAALSLPLLFVMRVQTFNQICGQFCIPQWNWIDEGLGFSDVFDVSRPLYGCFVFAYQTAIPLIVSILMIKGIHSELKRTEEQLESETQPSAVDTIQRYLLWQAVALFVSATPIGLINMLDDLNLFDEAPSIHRVLALTCGLISLLTPYLDFFVYCLLNKNFREQTKLVVCCFCKRNRGNQPQRNPETIEMLPV